MEDPALCWSDCSQLSSLIMKWDGSNPHLQRQPQVTWPAEGQLKLQQEKPSRTKEAESHIAQLLFDIFDFGGV